MNQSPEAVKALLTELMAEFPICEYAFGSTADIPTSERVLTICQTDCPRYGKNWACPPHAGDIQENRARLAGYSNFLLYSTVWNVADAWNLTECQRARKEHEVMARQFRHRVLAALDLKPTSREEEEHPPILFLSVGCSICDECACPKEPCRHPEERVMTLESHGILIMQLAEDMGLTYAFDGTTVVYFSLLLF